MTAAYQYRANGNGNGNGRHAPKDALIVPPHSTETEEAVLGSLMIDPDAMARLSFLLAEHFYIVKHRWIYDAMQRLQAQHEPIDLLTVSNELSAVGKLDDIGGEAYIAQLTDSVPTALNVEAYARSVENLATRRKMITAAGDIARLAYDQTKPLEDVRIAAQSTIAGACKQSQDHQKISVAEGGLQWFSEFSEMIETGVMAGIPTGIPDVDYMLGGYKPGKMIVYAAPPGMGKTTLMKVSALHAARRVRKSVGVWTLEMGVSEYVEMLAAEIARVDVSAAAINRMNEDQKAVALHKVREAMGEIYRLHNLHIFYTPGITPSQWLYQAQALQASHGLDLVIFDYIQIAKGEVSDNREQEVNSIALALKTGAGLLNVPVLAGSQVNDNGQVRESRGIEQHADTVVYLKRGSAMNEVIATFGKNRRGPTGDRSLHFNKSHSHIGGQVQP